MTDSVKIELMERLKTARLREVRALRPYLTLVNDVEDMGSSMVPDRQYKFQTRAEFLFEQFAGEDAVEHVHKVAVRAVARSVYGDVIEHLRDVVEEMYKDGLHDHTATQKLNALLSALHP